MGYSGHEHMDVGYSTGIARPHRTAGRQGILGLFRLQRGLEQVRERIKAKAQRGIRRGLCADTERVAVNYLDELVRIHDYRSKREDTILDAYIRSGHTGRSYQEERDKLLQERGLGTIRD